MALTQIPRQIGGFEILGSLGQGGMGIVYCVRDQVLQRDLAVKVQTGDWQRHPELLQRFLREARILAKINHPNVVQIYSVGEHEGAPFFVMELLDSSIADAARLKSPGIAQCKRWMLEAARGLAAIHDMNVVHRDIKPGNLLLTRASSVEEEHVKVADLGIASAGEQFGAPLTRAGAVLGTTGYLPPEAFRLEHTLDARADQYSLGVVFFELLAKRGPYQDMGDQALLAAILEPRTAPDVREFRPEVDAATAQIIARMLKDDPDERFESTQALVQELIRVQGVAARPAHAPTERVAPPTAVSKPPAAPIWSPPAPVPAPPTPPVPPAPQQSLALAPSVQPPAPIPAARTLQRDSAPAKSGSGLKVAVAVLSAVLISLLAGLLYLGLREEPDEDSGAASAEPAAIVPGTEPSSGAATFTAREADSDAALQSEAWAKYVLAHYVLRSRADKTKLWKLSLLEQDDGVIAAELEGVEDETIELTGRVEGQREETVDDTDWDIYELKLRGTGDRKLTVRIEFSDDETAGEGSYSLKGERQRFDVEDSIDLTPD